MKTRVYRELVELKGRIREKKKNYRELSRASDMCLPLM